MKIVIIGDGRVGHKLAFQLSDEEYENMVRSEAVKEAKLIIDESGA